MISSCNSIGEIAPILLIIVVGAVVLLVGAPRHSAESADSLGMATRRLKIGGAMIAILGGGMMLAARVIELIPLRYGEWGEGTAVFGSALLAYGFIKSILLKKLSND